MNKVIVIGIAGQARVGKTSLAHAIWKRYHDKCHCKLLSFADALKDECAKATDLPRRLFDDSQYKEELRPLMQWWGTEFRRNTVLGGYDNYWCDKVVDQIEAYSKLHAASGLPIVFLIPDVRFDVEVATIRQYPNGHIVRLEGKNAPKIASSAHVSEKVLASMLLDGIYTTDHSEGITALDSVADELYARFVGDLSLIEDEKSNNTVSTESGS